MTEFLKRRGPWLVLVLAVLALAAASGTARAGGGGHGGGDDRGYSERGGDGGSTHDGDRSSDHGSKSDDSRDDDHGEAGARHESKRDSGGDSQRRESKKDDDDGVAAARHESKGDSKHASKRPAAVRHESKGDSKQASKRHAWKKQDRDDDHGVAAVRHESKRDSKHASRRSEPAKVTICHSTGSETNPYVRITVSTNAVKAHSRHHDGRDIVPAPASGCPQPTVAAAKSAERPKVKVTHEHSKVEHEKSKATHEQPKTADVKADGSEPKRHKVLVCHATRSATNPFVLISIARAGWDNGHSKHEGDKLVRAGLAAGEQASASDLAFVAANCAAPAQPPAQGAAPAAAPQAACPTVMTTTTVRDLVGVWHKTGSKKNPYVFITPSESSAHFDSAKHEDDIPVYSERTVQVPAAEQPDCAKQEEQQQAAAASTPATPPAAPAPVAPVAPVTPAPAPAAVAPVAPAAAAQPVQPVQPAQPAETPQGGVQGVAYTAPESAAPAAGQGGVLGEVVSLPQTLADTVTGETLPFTGVPLWIAALLGFGLVAAGLALRRHA